MRQQVLKALANPARIFYVPYTLAVINFAIQFIVFSIFFVLRMILFHKDLNPLIFMGSLFLVHSILAMFSKKDPQFGQIISSKLNLLTKKIPRKLAA
jgi:type IV secretory pathway VirB3-like protein